jgi:hypothetical protein
MYTAKKQLIIVYSSLGIGWLLLMFAIFSFILSGCAKAPFGGSGHVVTTQRHTDKFTDVVVDGPFLVQLQEADSAQIEINAEDNLMQFIETYVKGSTLYVKLRDNVKLNYILNIRIYLKNSVYHSVTYSGEGSVKNTDTLHTDHFSCTINGVNSAYFNVITPKLDIALNGNGYIELSGNAHTYNSEIKGNGKVGGLGLGCTDATINVEGSGGQTITVLNTLDVSIQGSGNVQYKGDPSVNSDIQGSGAVIKL